MPSEASVGAGAPEFVIRSVTFSPNVVGRIATRMSTERSPVRSDMRPSWGTRFSAMSSSAITFRRLVIGGWRFLGTEASSRMTPSTRALTSRRLRLGREVDVGRAELQRAAEQLVDALDRRCARGCVAQVDDGGQRLLLELDFLVETFLAGIDPCRSRSRSLALGRRPPGR